MAEPVIVPPTPTINQPTGPSDNSPGMEQVQRAFDTAYPDKSPAAAQVEAPPAPESPPEAPKPPETPAPTEKPPEDFKIPNFLEEALKTETAPQKPEIDPEAEFPDELPQEERKSRIKGLREAYKKLKTEVATLRNQPNRDPQEQARLQWLEQNNRQMAEMLSRVGVEHSAEFQQQIIAPLTQSWNEAARIVRDAGADPQELAKAMSLSGKAQFEALDMLFQEMPESAKLEAHDALRTYKRFEEARQRAVANAPRTLEALRERESARQYQELGKQREGMAQMFDRALSLLRDQAKVEVFMKTDDPESKWWNDQGEQVVQQGRQLFLENTDMEKVAMACLLAPTADAYRKLFIKSQQKVGELQKIIRERLEGEPNLRESGGSAGNLTPTGQMQEDLKKPFADVFLREFHRAQGRAR
jgi:hypothetical protein